jgi:hypothetical protein
MGPQWGVNQGFGTCCGYPITGTDPSMLGAAVVCDTSAAPSKCFDLNGMCIHAVESCRVFGLLFLVVSFERVSCVL